MKKISILLTAVILTTMVLSTFVSANTIPTASAFGGSKSAPEFAEVTPSRMAKYIKVLLSAYRHSSLRHICRLINNSFAGNEVVLLL